MRILGYVISIILSIAIVGSQAALYIMPIGNSPDRLMLMFFALTWSVFTSVALLACLRRLLVRSLLRTTFVSMIGSSLLVMLPVILQAGFNPTDCQSCYTGAGMLIVIFGGMAAIVAGILTLVGGWLIRKTEASHLSETIVNNGSEVK